MLTHLRERKAKMHKVLRTVSQHLKSARTRSTDTICVQQAYQNPNSLLTSHVERVEQVSIQYQEATTGLPARQDISTLLGLIRMTMFGHNGLLTSQFTFSTATLEERSRYWQTIIKQQRARLPGWPAKHNISTLLEIARMTMSVHNDLIGSHIHSLAATLNEQN